MARKSKQAAPTAEPKRVKIHYLKSANFRNIFVSGAHGGASHGNGMIYMNLFADRPPIPQVTVHNVKDGILEEILEERVTKKDVIREIEAGVIMDLRTAKLLKDWLQSKIDVLEGKR
jgi:hypothetical protein